MTKFFYLDKENLVMSAEKCIFALGIPERKMAEALKMSESTRALLDRARRYCSMSEQCEDAVRQKLVVWGATPVESDEVVKHLYSEDYLNDERYACSYCESKILGQHWGRQKVLYQLRLKHLPRPAVNAGMARVSEEAYHRVLAETAKKKRQELEGKVDDLYVMRQKVTAFLVSRGFTLSEIGEVEKEQEIY